MISRLILSKAMVVFRALVFGFGLSGAMCSLKYAGGCMGRALGVPCPLE